MGFFVCLCTKNVYYNCIDNNKKESEMINAIKTIGDFLGLLIMSAAILFLPLLVQFFGTLDFFTDSCGVGFMSKYFGYYLNLYCGG